MAGKSKNLSCKRETKNFKTTEEIWSATILPAQLAAVCAGKNIRGISTYNNEDEKAVYEKAEKRTKHRNEIKYWEEEDKNCNNQN